MTLPTRPTDQTVWDTAFPSFLGIFENLTELELDFTNGPGLPRTLFQAMQRLPQFSKLRRFSLANATVKPLHLLKFLDKLEKLEEMEFALVNLSYDAQNICGWDVFLMDISRVLHLKKFKLWDPMQNMEDIGFDLEDSGDGYDIQQGFVFEGASFATDIEKAAKSVVVVPESSDEDSDSLDDFFGHHHGNDFDSEEDFDEYEHEPGCGCGHYHSMDEDFYDGMGEDFYHMLHEGI
jgi:hypothetical protein